VNGGWWRTKIHWDRWDKRNAMEKLKIHTNFHLETMKRRCSLGNIGLDEM
jgi:hypothetical protein